MVLNKQCIIDIIIWQFVADLAKNKMSKNGKQIQLLNNRT